MSGSETYLSFIQSQLRPAEKTPQPVELKRSVTISRQSGCGAHAVARALAQYLQEHSPVAAAPWTVFDRDLMEKVLADHNLPERLAQFMPEDAISGIKDAMEELFGVRPAAWTLVEQTAETILRLASLGNVIILGRGANIITAKLPGTLHVRLVGSLNRRIAAVQEYEGLSHAVAADRIRAEDLGRQRYLRKYFDRDIDDPLLYHLVINTDLLPPQTSARLIGDAVLSRQSP